MKAFLALLLSGLLIYPPDTATELVRKSYLDLLQLEQIQKFPEAEIKNIEAQLNREKEAEQARLKKEEDRIDKELKAARKSLDELNKKASRDDTEPRSLNLRLPRATHDECLAMPPELHVGFSCPFGMRVEKLAKRPALAHLVRSVK